MRKTLYAGIAALTLAGSLGAAAIPAAAQDRDDYYYNPGYYRDYDQRRDGDWNRRDWDDSSYSDRDWGRSCVRSERVWSPYYGRYVMRDYRYAC